MPIHSLTPYAHVADIHRSIAFYGRHGLEVQNRHFDDEVLAWAFLSTPGDDAQVAGARLMVAAADGPIDGSNQGVLSTAGRTTPADCTPSSRQRA